jgi:hypothetical protein
MRLFRGCLLVAAVVLPVSAGPVRAQVIPGADSFTCEARGDTVHLSWGALNVDPAIGLQAVLERDGELIARLAAGDVGYDDMGVPAGLHTYRLVFARSDGTTVALECQVVVGGEPGVKCTVEGNVVTVVWEVPDDILALGFIVSRDGTIVATLGADARSYSEEAPPGAHTYTVSTDNRLEDPNVPGGAPPDFLIGTCRVVVEDGFGIKCEVDGDVVSIGWEDLPINVAISGFVVRRDGREVATLGADARSYSEEAPPGEHVYTVVALTLPRDPDQPDVGVLEILVGSCQVVVEGGPGVWCAVEGNTVTIRWEVPSGILARGFIISRDNEVVATLGSDARSYRDEAPPGAHSYTVATNNRPAADSLIGSCQVVVEGEPGIECAVEGSSVTIQWQPLDASLVPVVRIDIRRDGAVVASLRASATSYREEAPPGEHLYTVVAVVAIVDPAVGNVPGEDLVIGSCRVVVEGGFGIECAVEGNIVSIAWEELPIDVPIRGFAVTRNGQQVAMLGADATSYREEAPPGEHVYTVWALTFFRDPNVAGVGTHDILVGSCRVVVEGEPGLPPPARLRCGIAESFPIQVILNWTNPVVYDSIVVTRNGERLDVLDGSATHFSETDPGPGRYVYGVYGTRGREQSEAATCVVEIQGVPGRNRLSLVPETAPPGEDPNAAGIVGSDTLTAVLENVDPVQAWSFGICSDPALLEVADATIDGTSAGELNGGAGPTFLVLNSFENGLTMAAVIDTEDPEDVLPPDDAHSLLTVRYQPGPDAELGVGYRVSYCDDLGDPPVALVVVVNGQSVHPATSPGTVVFPPRPFLRGDGNNDGEVNASDGIYVLDWLFRGGAEPPCLEAADINGNRQVNIADPVYLFQALFIGGPPPPAPYPECGSAASALGCKESACDA